MKKRWAIILALLLTILIASNFYLFSLNGKVIKNQRETVMIERVIDGDTIVLKDGRTLRLLNINSPEKKEKGNNPSSIFLSSFINKSIEAEFLNNDKYNRNLSRLYSPEYINLELVRLGLAKKFLVQYSELKIFANAEEKAIKNEKGIWKKSAYFDCFKIVLNPKEEIARIDSLCGEINFKNWVIKDESRKSFMFNHLLSNSITLHSGLGESEDNLLFWQSKTDIWNNDRDTLYLFDPEGKIALHYSYGY